MEKYLFNDGTNVTRELLSKEELDTAIKLATDPEKISIWIFNTSEWLSYAEFSKRSVAKMLPHKKVNGKTVKATEVAVTAPVRKFSWVKRIAAILLAAVTILLVYNFTKINWVAASPLQITSARPANTPLINVDSLIENIELTRGQKLDKITRTNLRIRNIWPERIVAQLTADRDTSKAGNRFRNSLLSIDNSTGYQVDEAIVKLIVWKNDKAAVTDTFHFRNMGYAEPARKNIDTEYKGDSISVSFVSIKSKAFNFCYNAERKSNYGNFNDRWFCKE